MTSGGIGHGSEFTISLPRTLLAASVVPTEEIAKTEPPRRSSRFKVLVADDQDAADTLGLLLEFAGCAVTVTHNGQEALRTSPGSPGSRASLPRDTP